MRPLTCTPPLPAWELVRARYRRRRALRQVVRWSAVVWIVAVVVGFAPWPEWIL